MMRATGLLGQFSHIHKSGGGVGSTLGT
jgi:hypothetical protein